MALGRRATRARGAGGPIPTSVLCVNPTTRGQHAAASWATRRRALLPRATYSLVAAAPCLTLPKLLRARSASAAGGAAAEAPGERAAVRR